MSPAFVFASVLGLILLPFSAAQCVYSSTECQCMSVPAGNECLRYSTGVSPNIMCEVYACNSGYVCDCGGTDMCDVSDCTSTRDVYRPMNNNPLTIGQTVSCELATQVTCVNLRPSPTPTSTPTATPSTTPSATPSVSTTPSATPSNSPPATIPIGGACTPSDTCVSGADCNCLGTCQRTVSIEVTGLGDDSLLPWMCGNSFGSATTNYQQTGTWTYTGPCSDLYLEVNNVNGGHTGTTAAVREVGSSWLPTVLSGSGGVTGITAYNPPTGFMTNPSYDFSSWIAPVEQTTLSGNSNYQSFMSTYGSDTWTYQNGHLGSSQTQTFFSSYYKITLPFC